MERSGTTKVAISSDERRTEGERDERDERGEPDMTKSRAQKAQKARKPVTIEGLIGRAGKRVSRTNERVC